jgi:hypothetical protein
MHPAIDNKSGQGANEVIGLSPERLIEHQRQTIAEHIRHEPAFAL